MYKFSQLFYRVVYVGGTFAFTGLFHDGLSQFRKLFLLFILRSMAISRLFEKKICVLNGIVVQDAVLHFDFRYAASAADIFTHPWIFLFEMSVLSYLLLIWNPSVTFTYKPYEKRPCAVYFIYAYFNYFAGFGFAFRYSPSQVEYGK